MVNSLFLKLFDAMKIVLVGNQEIYHLCLRMAYSIYRSSRPLSTVSHGLRH